MEFKTLEIAGFESAIRGMRNPLESWSQSDSVINDNMTLLGEKDLDLARRLCKAGASDRKFMRMLIVWADIKAPVYFLREFDTYKIGTVTNSTSMQHKGSSKQYDKFDFAIDDTMDLPPEDQAEVTYAWATVIDTINYFMEQYRDTKDITYFRLARQLMPMGYEYLFTWKASYETIYNMYMQRKNHKLMEWSGKNCYNEDGEPASFVTWAESLPYFKEICLGVCDE